MMLADVIAMVADGMAMQGGLYLVDVKAMVADGINIKTPKGRHIVRKAERALLNERVRSINNSITMFKMQ